MNPSTELTIAGEQYMRAYAAHYTTKDLSEALTLYRSVMSAHPDSQEATYSRSQIMDIVNKVVPAEELLDAQVELALSRLERELGGIKRARSPE